MSESQITREIRRPEVPTRPEFVPGPPELTAGLMKLGFEPKAGSPQDFTSLIADEIEAWTAAAKLAGIEPQ